MADIQQIIRSLKNQGIGILITDHQVREILSVTDRIYVVQSGKVLMKGTPQQIVSDPTVIKEYLGSNYANENVAVAVRSPIGPAAPPETRRPSVGRAGTISRSDRATQDDRTGGGRVRVITMW